MLMTDTQAETTSKRRRGGGTRNRNGASSTSVRRGPRGRQPAEQVLAELEPLVSALIRENRDLRRQLDKLSREPAGATSAAVDRTLRALERRVRSSLNGDARTRQRQRSSTSSRSARQRRTVTNPEVLERRRQALAKAREALAAKRAGTDRGSASGAG